MKTRKELHMTTRESLNESFEKLKITAMRVKRERDAMYSALKLCLLHLERTGKREPLAANDQILSIVREALALAEDS